MKPVSRPSPQEVRDWMKQRQVERKPLPTLEEIRTSLGWKLIQGAECAR